MDWKTTIPGVVSILVTLAGILGYKLPPEFHDALVTVLLGVIGIFATSRGVNK